MSSLEIRCAAHSDVAALAALSSAVGFNQTAADWTRIVELAPHGTFVGTRGDRIVASSVGMTYGDAHGWVGMVIVSIDCRQQGYGRAMTDASVDYLRGRGCTQIGLDARPAGVHMYEALGFVTDVAVTRWECETAHPSIPSTAAGTPVPPTPSTHAGHDVTSTVRAATPADLAALVSMDARAFGADRSALLAQILSSPDCTAVVLESGCKATGFRMARTGVGPLAVGPVVAAADADAADLRALLIPRATGGIAVNLLPDARSRDILAEARFRPVATFQRMFLGGPPRPTTTGTYRAALGPEFG